MYRRELNLELTSHRLGDLSLEPLRQVNAHRHKGAINCLESKPASGEWRDLGLRELSCAAAPAFDLL
jgi:hypothetical protein